MTRAERAKAETARPRQLTHLAVGAEPPAPSGHTAAKSAAAAFGLAIVIAALAFAGEHKFGLGGLALPLAVAALVAAMRRPTVMFYITIGLTILCEGSTISLPAMRYLYSNLYGGIEPVTILVLFTFLSVAVDVLRSGRRLRLPTLPAFTVMLMVFAGVDGIAVAHGVGIGLKQAILALTPLIELILIIVSVYNLNLTNEQIVRLLRWGLAAGAAKAVMGLVVMALGLSADVDTGTTITFYEPAANWVGLMTILGLLAAGLGDGGAARTRLADARERLRRSTFRRAPSDRPLIETHTTWLDRRRAVLDAVRRTDSASASRFPSRGTTIVPQWLRSRWGVLVFALAFACLLLSYRRSFWIGAAVALIILIPLASTPRKRLMILPVVLLVAGAVWTVQAVDNQAVTPIAKRATSLQPGALSTNPEDRYRLDERANVIAEIKANPVLGIGVAVPWVATVRSMGIEHPDGRDYVHFGLLYWWLKTGLLGAAFYIAFLLAMATLAFQTWRGHVIREFRYFGLASLCAVFALAAIETTAAFTGVDPRFSVLIGAQFGLLAVLAERRSDNPAVSVEPRVLDHAELSRSHRRPVARSRDLHQPTAR